MFLKKKKSIKYLVISDKELASYDIIKNKLINKKVIEMDNSVLNKGVIIDWVYFKYCIEKILVNGNDEELIIRYSANDSLFRAIDNVDLDEKEFESYTNYNINDFFPFKVNEYKFKTNKFNSKGLIYGIKSSFIKALYDILHKMSYKSIILTTFPSEALNYINQKCLKGNYTIIDFSGGVIEYITCFESNIVDYNQIEFNPETNNESNFKEIENKMFKQINSLNIVGGDKDYYVLNYDERGTLLNILKSLESANIKNINFEYDKYSR